MTKAFLYHPIGGKVVRCICAGIDSEGQPRWVNVTPGEKAEALIEIDRDGSHSRPLMVLGVDDEVIPSIMIAKVLAKAMIHPGKSFVSACSEAVSRMRRIGMKWDERPLGLKVYVHKDKKEFFYEIKEDSASGVTLAIIDGVFAPEEMYKILSWFFMALEVNAEIPIKEKTLCINSQLKKEIGRRFQSLFDHVEKNDV